MLRSVKDLEGYSIGAIDGAIGQVKDFYFDDDAWVIRYLVVEAGAWLKSRKVLVSPIAIGAADWTQRSLPAAITMQQVKDSPGIDTDKPVSRQHEVEYLGYYGYPYYWGGIGIWGGDMYPNTLLPGYDGFASSLADRTAEEAEYAKAMQNRHRNDDPHLRSCNAVIGYHMARSGTSRACWWMTRPGRSATW